MLLSRTMVSFSCRFALVLVLSVGPRAQTGDVRLHQQKARDLLNQMIIALGGQAYLTLQDAESEGRAGRFYHGRSEASTVFHRFWQWPDKERVELTKQRDVVQLTNGDEIHEITLRGARLVDPNKDDDARVYLERQHHGLEIIVRRWMNEPGTALLDEGPALTENHSVERITITNSKHDTVTLSIDTDTHLPVQKTFVIRSAQGDRDEIGEVYDNWKMIQGINTAYNTLETRNGELQRQYSLSFIAYNKHLQDSLFSPPAGQAQPK